ncbi:MAG: cytochrome c biogenesis protein ResB [Bacillota bacterium]
MSGWRPVFNFLASVKLAMVLLIAFTAALIAGATIYKNVFGSWWFVAVVGVFLINTCCCTVRQISRARTRIYKTAMGNWSSSPRFTGKMFIDDQVDPDVVVETAANIMRKHHYRVRERPRDQGIFVWGSKFSWGYFSATVFHLGLLVVVIGGLISLTTHFRGAFYALEGSVFTDQHDAYITTNEGLFYPKEHRDFQIRVDDVILKYDNKGLLRDFMSKVTILEKGKEVKKGLVSGPAPFKYKQMIFYKKRFGYAPGMTIRTPDGKETKFRVVMDTSMYDDWIRHKGEFRIPGTLYDVEAYFYADLAYSDKDPTLETHRIKSPGLTLKVKRDREKVFQGKLPLQGKVRFDNYTLSFDNYRDWYGLTVVKDWGIPVVFTGFLILIMGAAMIYLLVPRDIAVHLVKQEQRLVLTIHGRTGKYHHLFEEELQHLKNNLQNNLKQGEETYV